jgi:hypothetical protein
MKKVVLVLSLFIFCQMFGQKKYSFDYGLNYERKDENGKKSSEVYLVNSKQNNFFLYVKDNDSIYSEIHFFDFEKLIIHGKMKNSIVYKTSDYIANCDDIFQFKNPFKNEAKNYKFINLNDTIINDTSYFHYKTVSLKSLRFQKRKDIQTIHYIINKDSNFFTPFFLHATLYEMFKYKNVLPNGYPKMIFMKNLDNKLTLSLNLLQITKIKRTLTIPEECMLTNSKKINFN